MRIPYAYRMCTWCASDLHLFIQLNETIAFQCLQNIWNEFWGRFEMLYDFFSIYRFFKKMILWATSDYNIQLGYRFRWWKLLFTRSTILTPLPLFVLDLRNILSQSQFRLFFIYVSQNCIIMTQTKLIHFLRKIFCIYQENILKTPILETFSTSGIIIHWFRGREKFLPHLLIKSGVSINWNSIGIRLYSNIWFNTNQIKRFEFVSKHKK